MTDTEEKKNDQSKKRRLWRSVDDLNQTPEFLEQSYREFPVDATELRIEPEGLNRRKFLGILGASMALAGVSATGCIRRPREHIYPDVSTPEGRLPGVPLFYSTSAQIAGGVLGLLATSTDGRPTKIDGNPRHVTSNPIAGSVLGSSNSFAQAEILNLYDPDRGQKCLFRDEKVSFKTVKDRLIPLLGKAAKQGGRSLALLYASEPSPTFLSLLGQFRSRYPNALVVEQSVTYSENRKAGLRSVVGDPVDVVYDFSRPDVILSVDSDFLGLEGESVRHARQFSEQRRVAGVSSSMSRLYSVGSHYNITAAAADHHCSFSSVDLPDFLVLLCSELALLGLSFPPELLKKPENFKNLSVHQQKWTKIVARDLFLNKQKSCVIVGDRQPAWLHALGFALNTALSSQAVSLVPDQASLPGVASLKDLKDALQNNTVETLIVVGGNPVYSSPSDFDFENLFKKVANTFYLGQFFDETASSCQFYVPKTHFLESWGDTRSIDGTVALRQPLIAPLFEDCQDESEFLFFLGNPEGMQKTAYDLVQEYWSGALPGFAANRDLYLKQGVVDVPKVAPYVPKNLSFASVSQAIELHVSSAKNDRAANALTIEFVLSRKVYDGRYANNAWMQELPDPIHKLVWDNALLVSPKTARRFGLNGHPKPGKKDVDLVSLTFSGKMMQVAVFEVPGIADNTGVLELGYGRRFGRVAEGCGFNAHLLRTSSAAWFAEGVVLQKTGSVYPLVSAQEHGSMSGIPGEVDRPPVVREATLSDFRKKPDFVLDDELLPREEQKNNLFPKPLDPAQIKWARQQWGMSIDLNSCIGCSACAVACQAENNIPVVGKEQVFHDREMHWIRIDRYFTGSIDDPEVRPVFQPLPCMQCENAPCEAVCPVAATVHSPDGLNDMAYNRCVGTRYCANNCPYKVRRFNFFNYSKMEDERNPLYAMQKNPNVTVRFRGVMEKCTYCVQRINAAKVKANKTENGLVPDGGIVTACQSVCPTGAIVFGDVADPMTAVSRLKAQGRNYSLLGELNTQPRTTYLAKLRNTNPEVDTLLAEERKPV